MPGARLQAFAAARKRAEEALEGAAEAEARRRAMQAEHRELAAAIEVRRRTLQQARGRCRCTGTQRVADANPVHHKPIMSHQSDRGCIYLQQSSDTHPDLNVAQWQCAARCGHAHCCFCSMQMRDRCLPGLPA